MSKPKDPPSLVHHLRFEVADLSAYEEAFKAFPWSKAIVKHITGKTGEHPHLHIWLEYERELTKVAVKDRLRAFNDIFKSISGQGEWSFRPHDSYANWCAYVKRNRSHIVLKGDEQLASCPIVAEPTGTTTPPKVITLKPKGRIDERMVAYCETEMKWKRGAQFSLDDYFSRKCHVECGRVLTQFLRGRFNDPQAVGLLRNMLYEFADEGLKEGLEVRFPEGALKYL